jgi:type IV secretory pathway VirJ component
MSRTIVASGLILLFAATDASAAVERKIEGGRLGALPVVLPRGEVEGLVFLFSDRTGWDADLEQAAQRLSGLGAAVLEVDLPAYLARLRQSEDADCHYLISEIEDTSKRLQRELGLERYRSPILAGTGMGSALVYAALAQAPAATVAGAASDGLVTRLDSRLPLCPGAPATPTGASAGAGFNYGPKAGLPGWWRLAAGPEEQAAARHFAAGIPQAEVVELAGGTSLDERLARLLADRLGQAAGPAAAALDLPLVELPAAGPGDLLAVFYSGDGGWRDLDKQIGEILAAHGIATIGVDSLRYFWQQRTPQQVADDLAAILDHYRSKWDRDQAILLGYSFGAGVLPFAVNRLPAAERAMVRQVSLLGVEKLAQFEFHVTNWLGAGGGADARPVLPEIAKLDPRIVQCFYGADEDDTACTAPELARAERIETEGGHHFDGDYAAIADKIMAGVRRRSQP